MALASRTHPFVNERVKSWDPHKRRGEGFVEKGCTRTIEIGEYAIVDYGRGAEKKPEHLNKFLLHLPGARGWR